MENGMSVQQAAEIIKEQTDLINIHIYLYRYIKEGK
jgi:hypothetical protein